MSVVCVGGGDCRDGNITMGYEYWCQLMLGGPLEALCVSGVCVYVCVYLYGISRPTASLMHLSNSITVRPSPRPRL